MIRGFQFVGSVGCFDAFQGTADTELRRLNLIYAENGRGKTTLVALLRSLADGSAAPITGRTRIQSQHDPRVVIVFDDGTNHVFQAGAWSAAFDSLLIFDDHFVDDNVYSGLAIGPDHRQNLHEVILGSQGVRLKRRVDELTDRISELTRELRAKRAAIPVQELRGLDVDTFCALPSPSEADVERRSAIARQLAALQQAEHIRTTRFFSNVEFPEADLGSLRELLQRQLDDLDAEAVSRVQGHLARLGDDAERWVGSGVPRLFSSGGSQEVHCPFCGQGVDGVELVDKYRAYFGEAYRELLAAVESAHHQYGVAFGGDELARVQRELAVLSKQHEFWRDHIDLPALTIDVEKLAQAWQAAREGVLDALAAKKAAPLERHELSEDAVSALQQYSDQLREAHQVVEALVGRNDAITALKEATAASDADDLTAELKQLDAAQGRHIEPLVGLCEEYVVVRDAKTQAEGDKRDARRDLDAHREHAFPAYKTRVNHYLSRFGAGFRLGDVAAQDQSGRASASYHLTIREATVPLVARGDDDSMPCFKTALSAGDRNTLALSFFFARADLDGDLSRKVVVIDDPVSSLDDGRMTNTVSALRTLAGEANQLIVLSHAKPFLCRLHKHASPATMTCLQLRRAPGDSSELAPWEPDEDQFTVYDHRHKLLREFAAGTEPNIRQVAQALRPTIEGYLRVAFPEQYPPGTLLGQFRNRAQTAADAGAPIMDPARLQEVTEITEYANKFHHDTNPAWESENVSDTELQHFTDRVLTFVSH